MALFQKKHTYATKSLKSTYTQGIFLKRLGTLLAEGFSLKEALLFLRTTTGQEVVLWIDKIEKGFEEGHLLHDQLAELNFSRQICSQIYFSMTHGKFAESIYHCGSQQLKQVERRKKLNQLLSYPLMLIIFMIGMLLAMRYILLPHIKQLTSSTDVLTRVIIHMIDLSPVWMIGLALLTLLGLLGLKVYLNNKSAIEKNNFIAEIPIIKEFYRLYMSQYFAFEWAQLLVGGSSLKEITTIMKESQTSSLVREIGHYLEKRLTQGMEFHEILNDFLFLKPEIKDIVQHGEVSGNLGKELRLYSTQCEEELQIRIDKFMQWVQPIVFSVIAIMIISIYAAILLPTFSLLEGL